MHCLTTNETNSHIWLCSEAALAISNIIAGFKTKMSLSDFSDSDILKAIQDFSTERFVYTVKASLEFSYNCTNATTEHLDVFSSLRSITLVFSCLINKGKKLV